MQLLCLFNVRDSSLYINFVIINRIKLGISTWTHISDLSTSLQVEEGLEVVEGELVCLLGAGQDAVRQLQLLLLQLQDPRLHSVLAQEAGTKRRGHFKKELKHSYALMGTIIEMCRPQRNG